MKNTLLSIAFLIGAITFASGQDYNTAVGARLGYPLSLSIKHFLSEDNAVEGYVGFRGNVSYNWISVSGAYQKHTDINIEDLDGFRWYWGAGASAYFWNYQSASLRDQYNSLSIGVQGYLGVEYTFSETPLSLSADWVPTFFLNGFSSGFGSRYGSLGVRYVLGG